MLVLFKKVLREVSIIYPLIENYGGDDEESRMGQASGSRSICGNKIESCNEKEVISPVKRKKGLKRTKANQNKNDIVGLSSEDNSDADCYETRKTWELGKQLGLWVEMEEEVIQNLSKFRRSLRKIFTPKRFRSIFLFFVLLRFFWGVIYGHLLRSSPALLRVYCRGVYFVFY
jgi:hypothetical protein